MPEIRLHLAAIVLLSLGGFAALLAARSARWPTRLGVGGAVLGCAVGLLATFQSLVHARVATLHLPWQVPYGSFRVGVDGLTSLFLLPAYALAALAAVYGAASMRAHAGRTALAAHWFFYDLTVAAMVLVLLARDGLLFLIAWEAMSIAPYFLVTFEDRRESVRAAGWTYLVAAHLGAAFLLVVFLLLGRGGGGLDFAALRSASGAVPAASLLFVLALAGFGAKAGFVPLHVWLPEAHPAAPSHVSALFSGVLIKMGIYGLLRVLTFLGPAASWWGPLLVGVGLASALGGIGYAIAQRDLKRLLAYSSVENIGIIALGIGLGLVGQERGAASLVVLGYGGALLHVLNHAAFKGLLFLAAGSVLHATGGVDLEHLGGLQKRMPRTALLFLIGAAAICGLPPLNGFASEFLIYMAAASGGVWLGSGSILATASAIAGLAAIGGLAAACFAKAFGIAFLGEPRRALPRVPHDPAPAMLVSMGALAASCAAFGLAAPWVVPGLSAAVAEASGTSPAETLSGLQRAAGCLRSVTEVGAAFLALAALLALLRRSLLAHRVVEDGTTWGCGYARPGARMQYTASSFAQPITGILQPLLRARRRFNPPRGPFPAHASLDTETPDAPRRYLYRPLFDGVAAGLYRLRWLQHGNLHLYVLYIALTLVVLLIWKL
jgi:formate hydrogenlyase subunit 3/multisubunit Na+/H+ antiporter MnhD subunit